MEIIIGLAVVAVLAVMWIMTTRPHTNQDTAKTAPYKVEAPAQESTPVAEPAKEVTSVTASKPARAPKAPAAVKKKAVATTKSPVKKVVATKTTAKRPVHKK